MSKQYRFPIWGSTNLKGIRHRKHRFPIKQDNLLSYLDQYNISSITEIVYRLRTSRDVLISARYIGEILEDRVRDFGLNIDNFENQIGKSIVRLYSVRPEEEEIAKEALLTEALPLLCEWLVDAEKQTYTWRRNDHSMVLRFKKRELSFTLDESGWW